MKRSISSAIRCLLSSPPMWVFTRSLRSLFRKKVFFAIFYFARARFFLLKGKENFFAGLCSERAGRRGFASARARRNSPHTPLPPRPRLGWRKFLRRAFGSFPCPSLPARKRLRNSLKFVCLFLKFAVSLY